MRLNSRLGYSGSDVELTYSTYFGGRNPDGGYGIGVDSSGAVYVFGGTNSPDFPLQAAYQKVVRGQGDNFAAKLNPDEPAPTDTVTSTPTPVPPTPTPCDLPFTDVTGNLFYQAIAHLYCRGVVSGMSATTYVPSSTSTRGQFARVVVKGFGIPFYTPVDWHTFTDVPQTYFAYLYVETGFHAGILNGYDAATCRAAGAIPPCYLPNRAITRAELTRLVVTAANYALTTPSAGPSFVDVPESNFAYAYIKTAYAHGIIHGVDATHFAPGRSIRRDEMAGIVYEGIVHMP